MSLLYLLTRCFFFAFLESLRLKTIADIGGLCVVNYCVQKQDNTAEEGKLLHRHQMYKAE